MYRRRAKRAKRTQKILTNRTARVSETEPLDPDEFVIDMALRAVEEHWDDWRTVPLRDVLLVAIDAAFEAAG